jgi:hypothetical protein
MVSWRLPLPDFAPVSTAPLSKVALADLLATLQECRRYSTWASHRNHVKPGFARLWLHLVLERGMDPRRAVLASIWVDHPVLKAYLAMAVQKGLGDRTSLSHDVLEISRLAAQLWGQAKAAQSARGTSQGTLPGLDFDSSFPER